MKPAKTGEAFKLSVSDQLSKTQESKQFRVPRIATAFFSVYARLEI